MTSVGRTPRLYVAPPLGPGPREVVGLDHHYLFRVRRLTLGDAVIVFDGEGHEAEAEVRAIDGERATIEVGPARAAPRRGPERWALLALIKGERMDLAIEKLVELGVAHIAPFVAERSVVKVAGDRAAQRERRYQALARAAAAQCRAAHVPTVWPIGDLGEALRRAHACELKLAFSERPGTVPLAEVLPAAATSIAWLTGPEGGLTDAEGDAAAGAGFVAVGLGPRMMRAETAAIAAAAVLGFALADLRTANP